MKSSLHRQPPPPSAAAIVRRRATPAPAPAQKPADERCDYIPVPPIGYDDEGYPVEDSVGQSQRHGEQSRDWHGALADWCRHQGLGEVFADLVVPYERDQRHKVVCPDLMVALRAERRRERSSYKLWEQPTPEFALESLSNSTWRGDVGEKKRLYRRLGVREYWLFDAAGKRIKERRRGYRLRPGTGSRAHLTTYRLVPENRWGRRKSEVLRLELCVREDELRFYDPVSGEFLFTAPESAPRRPPSEGGAAAGRRAAAACGPRAGSPRSRGTACGPRANRAASGAGGRQPAHRRASGATASAWPVRLTALASTTLAGARCLAGGFG